jgi:hypothetical protein
MGDSRTRPKQVKIKGKHCPHCEAITIRNQEEGLQYDIAKVKPDAKSKAKGNDGPRTTTSSSASKMVVKANDHDKVQVAKAPILNRNQMGTSKAPRQHKKPVVNKVTELTKHLHTNLEKDDGAAMECTYLAPDGRAVVSTMSEALYNSISRYVRCW